MLRDYSAAFRAASDAFAEVVAAVATQSMIDAVQDARVAAYLEYQPDQWDDEQRQPQPFHDRRRLATAVSMSADDKNHGAEQQCREQFEDRLPSCSHGKHA